MMRQPDLIYWAVSITAGVIIGLLGKTATFKPALTLFAGGIVAIAMGLISGAISGYSNSILLAMLWFATEPREDAMGLMRFVGLGYGLTIGGIVLEVRRRLSSDR